MKDTSSLISVIMPSYNAEKYVADAITSILNQTYKNLELIIINDCSTDKTGIIADNYAKKDKRVIVIHAKKKLYEVGARNLGLERAAGEYIAWQDADDISMPRRLEKQYQYLIKNKHADIVGSYIEFIDGNNKKIIRKNYDDWFKQILTKPHVNAQGLELITMPPTYFFKKIILTRLNKPYFRPITLGLDMDFQFRLMEKNIHIFNMPDILYHYRLHNSQLTSQQFYLTLSLGLIRYAAICRRTFGFDPLDRIFKKYKKIDGRDIITVLLHSLRIKNIANGQRKKFLILTLQHLFSALLLRCYAALPFFHKPWRAFKKILGR